MIQLTLFDIPPRPGAGRKAIPGIPRRWQDRASLVSSCSINDIAVVLEIGSREKVSRVLVEVVRWIYRYARDIPDNLVSRVLDVAYQIYRSSTEPEPVRLESSNALCAVACYHPVEAIAWIIPLIRAGEISRELATHILGNIFPSSKEMFDAILAIPPEVIHPSIMLAALARGWISVQDAVSVLRHRAQNSRRGWKEVLAWFYISVLRKDLDPEMAWDFLSCLPEEARETREFWEATCRLAIEAREWPEWVTAYILAHMDIHWEAAHVASQRPEMFGREPLVRLLESASTVDNGVRGLVRLVENYQDMEAADILARFIVRGGTSGQDDEILMALASVGRLSDEVAEAASRRPRLLPTLLAVYKGNSEAVIQAAIRAAMDGLEKKTAVYSIPAVHFLMNRKVPGARLLLYLLQEAAARRDLQETARKIQRLTIDEILSNPTDEMEVALANLLSDPENIAEKLRKAPAIIAAAATAVLVRQPERIGDLASLNRVLIRRVASVIFNRNNLDPTPLFPMLVDRKQQRFALEVLQSRFEIDTLPTGDIEDHIAWFITWLDGNGPPGIRTGLSLFARAWSRQPDSIKLGPNIALVLLRYGNGETARRLWERGALYLLPPDRAAKFWPPDAPDPEPDVLFSRPEWWASLGAHLPEKPAWLGMMMTML